LANITYNGCNKVKKAVENNDLASKKVKAILEAGAKGTNNGLIALLRADHAHVTGDVAVAFKWLKNGDLEIVGYGEKNKGKRVSGDGGYEWKYCP
jgi:hypothetical protein